MQAKFLEKFHAAKESVAKAMEPPLKLPIVPARYPGPIPKPCKTAVPTADEIHLSVQAARSEQAQKLSDDVDKGIAAVKDPNQKPTERLGGVLEIVRGSTLKAAVLVASTSTSLVRSHSNNVDVQQFAAEFGSIVDQFNCAHLSAHDCDVVSAGKTYPCVLHVTSSHLCLVGKEVKDIIPLNQIASLQPCVLLPTEDHSLLFFSVPDPSVRPDAVEVCTTQKTRFQFMSFSDSLRRKVANSNVVRASAAELFIASLDRAWRGAVRVPLDGVEYAQ
jgi:hypothetical protein